MLRIDNISKRYGDHDVFQGLTRTFEPGCYALCEEDNTGKSTLLKIIAGMVAPDTGDVWVGEHSLSRAPMQAKRQVAYVPDNCTGLPMQTGRGLLQQVATTKGAMADHSVLEFASELGLDPHLDKPFEQMSTGTLRKVFLTAAAIGKPAVVIADGPSDGLDARARACLAEQFRIWGRNRVVLFASHDSALVEACEATSIIVGDLRPA